MEIFYFALNKKEVKIDWRRKKRIRNVSVFIIRKEKKLGKMCDTNNGSPSKKLTNGQQQQEEESSSSRKEIRVWCDGW